MKTFYETVSDSHPACYKRKFVCVACTGCTSQEWFVKEWKKTGKKLDMGKSCVRFKKLDDVPLKVLAKLTRRCSVEEYIKLYEKQLDTTFKK